jgi:hypothetical protein
MPVGIAASDGDLVRPTDGRYRSLKGRWNGERWRSQNCLDSSLSGRHTSPTKNPHTDFPGKEAVSPL